MTLPHARLSPPARAESFLGLSAYKAMHIGDKGEEEDGRLKRASSILQAV